MAIALNHYSHAYIVQSHSNSLERGIELAAAMLCSGEGVRPCRSCVHCRKVFGGIHPDIVIVSRLVGDSGAVRREILVSQIREIIADAPTLPNEAERKVYIVEDADSMNHNAQNAFLKFLEEPPSFCCFILSVSNSEMLLTTVRSRCAEFSENTETPISLVLAEDFLKIVENGSSMRLLRFCTENESLSADDTIEFVTGVTQLITDALSGRRPCALSPRHAMELARLMRRCETYLRSNVGTRHIWGLLSARVL